MGISATTAWRWRRAGAIATVRIGRFLYITEAEAQNFSRRAKRGEFSHSPMSIQKVA